MPFFRSLFPVPATPALGQTERARTPRWVDLLLFLVLVAVGYGIIHATAGWREPIPARLEIDLSPWQLPRYAGLSTLRMAFAYLLSLGFSLAYARLAAASRAAERVMLPLLDILQSVPILSFMPGVVLALAALLPGRTLGLELAAIVLIFTSQAWNMAFSFHQSLITIPTQLSEAARIYRLGFWQRFSRLELPFGAIALIANSMMSWAGGWFFLMASEQFTLGAKDLRLPGLGSYLAHAAELGDTRALLLGLGTLVAVILLLDQIIWRPLVAWSDRFKVEQSTTGDAFTSPVLDILRGSELVAQARRALGPPLRRLDAWLTLVTDRSARRPFDPRRAARRRRLGLLLGGIALVGTTWGLAAAIHSLTGLDSADWHLLVWAAGATFTRTAIALAIAVAWTVPVGVAIGMNPRWAQRAAPIVQTIASVPATAVFPVLLLILLQPAWFRGLLRMLPNERARRFVGNAIDAATAYSDRRLYLLLALALAGVGQITTTLMYFANAMALATANVRPSEVLFASAVMTFGTFVAPSASGEGVRELVFVWLLGSKAGAAKAFLIGNLGFWIEKVPLSVPGGLILLMRRDPTLHAVTGEDLERVRRQAQAETAVSS